MSAPKTLSANPKDEEPRRNRSPSPDTGVAWKCGFRQRTESVESNKSSQLRLKCTLTVQIDDKDSSEDEVVDLDDDDVQGARIKMKRSVPHETFGKGMVFSPSVPSFTQLDSSPDSSTPSPLSGIACEGKGVNGEGAQIHRIVKTRSMPYLAVFGVCSQLSFFELFQFFFFFFSYYCLTPLCC